MKMTKQIFQELAAFILVGAAVSAVLLLSNCAGPGLAPSAPSTVPLQQVGSSAEVTKQKAKAPRQRAGLGTGWGDRINSNLGNTYFVRSSNNPFGGVAAIHYNDREGVEAMAPYRNKISGYQKAANGAVEWGIKSGWGTPDHYMSGSRRFVVGKNGKDYSIVVRNVSDSRLEIVLSVDGLDVLDGKEASFKKRGYIVGPGEKIEVKGFRTSYDAVAAFEFASVNASYSNLRHGKTRNVGVIGLAVFSQKGQSPWRYGEGELREREEAQPFAEAPLQTVHY